MCNLVIHTNTFYYVKLGYVNFSVCVEEIHRFFLIKTYSEQKLETLLHIGQSEFADSIKIASVDNC